jgi:hypothetical protein
MDRRENPLRKLDKQEQEEDEEKVRRGGRRKQLTTKENGNVAGKKGTKKHLYIG